MKPGDLVVPGIENFRDDVRVYITLDVDGWNRTLRRGEPALVLSHWKNPWGQDILTVLLPEGVRYLYADDVKVVEP